MGTGRTYRVGIVGLGRMGSTIDEGRHADVPDSIASACASCERLEVVAGSDPEPEKRDSFVKKWGVSSVYSAYEEMLAKEELDLVAVCVPSGGLPKRVNTAPDADYRGDAHADMGTAVSAAKIPMLYLEKAIACSMVRADELRDTCRRHGTVVNTGVFKRFNSGFRALGEAIEAGEIGEPRSVVLFCRSTLLHGHIHSIDLASSLIGDPKILSVRGDLLPPDNAFRGQQLPKDPFATFHVRFANGVEAWSVPSYGWEMEVEVIGTEGSIRSLNNGAGIQLRKGEWDEYAERPMHMAAPNSSVKACLEDIVDAYEAARPTFNNIDVAHHTTEALFAVAESHQRGGAWVDLPLENRDLYIYHV